MRCDAFHYICGPKKATQDIFVALFFTSPRVAAVSLCSLRCGRSPGCHYEMAGWFDQYGFNRGSDELIQRLRAKPVCIVSSQPRASKSPPTEIPLSPETHLAIVLFRCMQQILKVATSQNDHMQVEAGVCTVSAPGPGGHFFLLFIYFVVVFCYYLLRVNPPSS